MGERESGICTVYDSYLQDIDRTVWIAELSDGTKVYGDDYRYGEKDLAFKRLKSYLTESGLRIQKIYLKFRSHVELCQERNENTVGWYFGRGIGCWMGQENIHYMITGQVQEEPSIEFQRNCHCKKWRVPEVILDEEDTRDPEKFPENIIYDW